MSVYVRGSNKGIEYKRDDQSFFKGIVVKNNDPEQLLRVKVYLPEVSNQPLENWLQAFLNLELQVLNRYYSFQRYSLIRWFILLISSFIF